MGCLVGVVVFIRAVAWCSVQASEVFGPVRVVLAVWVVMVWLSVRAGLSWSRWLVMGTLATVLWAMVLRLVMTRRTLRSRVRYTLLPPDELDPTEQAVHHFARRLVRVSSSISGWTDRPARAVRVRLSSVDEGRMAYGIEVHGRARSALHAAVGTFAGVTVVDHAAGSTVPSADADGYRGEDAG